MEKRASRRDELINKQAGKPGLRGKINAKCVECIYDPYQSGTWRKQIENCTAPACPLYEVRPTSEGS
ncbi:MAG: hypothetical protein B6D73_15210 [gamma proteobacterium symbiont of Stewartia floridana]|nr:MAG: hypothetical protein B6D73_15210 [gamma proteobacterium symbiont of Stewartia floridana]